MEFKLDFELEDFYDFLLISFGGAWVDGWFLLNVIIMSALVQSFKLKGRLLIWTWTSA